MRAKNLIHLERLALTPADLARRGRNPEFISVTLGELLATWVAHDFSHTAQIARVIDRHSTQAVGPGRTEARVHADAGALATHPLSARCEFAVAVADDSALRNLAPSPDSRQFIETQSTLGTRLLAAEGFGPDRTFRSGPTLASVFPPSGESVPDRTRGGRFPSGT